MTRTFTAGRRLEIGDGWREVGDPVPEAHDWMRVDDWLHAGHLIEVEQPEEEFKATVAKLAPANAAAILERAGVVDDELAAAAHTARRATKPTTAPASLKTTKVKPKD